MKCNHCGQEITENAAFCTNCGMSVCTPPQQDTDYQPPVNPTYARALSMMQDGMLLPICILMTVATATGVLCRSFNVIQILFTIFLWLVWSKAKKNVLDTVNMRRVSGCVFAMEVIYWVCIVIYSLIATMCLAFLPYLLQYFEKYGFPYSFNFGVGVPDGLFASLTVSVILTIIVGILIVMAVVMLVINLFGIRNIHKFTKSLYMSAEHGGYPPEKIHTAKNWIMVLGILQAISALSNVDTSVWAAASSGCAAAAMIMLSILIGKYFGDVDN